MASAVGSSEGSQLLVAEKLLGVEQFDMAVVTYKVKLNMEIIYIKARVNRCMLMCSQCNI